MAYCILSYLIACRLQTRTQHSIPATAPASAPVFKINVCDAMLHQLPSHSLHIVCEFLSRSFRVLQNYRIYFYLRIASHRIAQMHVHRVRRVPLIIIINNTKTQIYLYLCTARSLGTRVSVCVFTAHIIILCATSRRYSTMSWYAAPRCSTRLHIVSVCIPVYRMCLHTHHSRGRRAHISFPFSIQCRECIECMSGIEVSIKL